MDPQVLRGRCAGHGFDAGHDMGCVGRGVLRGEVVECGLQLQRVAAVGAAGVLEQHDRSEEHTSELQSLMRISYAVFCLKKKNKKHKQENTAMNVIIRYYDHKSCIY